MTHWTFFLLWIRLFSLVFCEYKDFESLCASQQSCGNCVQTPRCVWCSTKVSDTNASSPLVRCVIREKFLMEGDYWCRSADVMDSANSMVLVENRPLSSIKGTNPVQVQPQRIQLNLRRGKYPFTGCCKIGGVNNSRFKEFFVTLSRETDSERKPSEEYRLTLKYSQADDYPVDLYYLMDLSASMDKHKDELSELGFQLAEAMRRLTSNFRLGFGSFIDKVTLPMTDTRPDRLKTPCLLDRNQKPCAPPYGYKNQMPLTENITLFKTQVKEAPTSGNLDRPEGGLDAMMQTIVCTAEIGWRQNARHLIVFSTDAGSHIAGDGRLAGIIEPNDCLCHLDEKGFYTHSLLQDYPSLSQINAMVRKHNVNVIFAVSNEENATYHVISQCISGSSVGTMGNKSQNIVELISGEYEKLVKSVTITDDAPKMIDVKFFSRCLEKNGELMERRECGGLRVGNIVEFEVALKAVDCPANSSEWQQTMRIKPRGINESLMIDLSIVCDCPCDRSGHPGYESNSEDCRGNGTLVCGMCSCNAGFYGKQCECEGNELGAKNAASLEECKPNNETSEVCSGRGACKCGTCDCARRPNPQEVFYGKYCECDNFSCKRSRGLVCGGLGKCECGTCNCLPGWGGETCDCKETNSTCMPMNTVNAEICSGRGDCICGDCHCQEKDNVRYSGQYCEECPTCPGQWCEELKNCVECMAYNAGPFVENGNCDQCPHQIDIVDVVKADPVKDRETGARICRMPGDAGCTFVFKYEYHRSGTGGDIKIFKILAEKERTCPAPVSVLGVAVGLVVSTVVIGFLILLIWKISTMIYDKREFEKFEQNRALAQWERGDNPLYKKATSTFNNPTFRQSTKD